MLTNDSHVIRKEACPECRKIGNDRTGDNLAVYSDGHTYCYRCHYSSGRKSFTQTVPKPTTQLTLPADVVADLPFEAREWLNQYGINRRDLIEHSILWSEHWSRIIFPYFNDTGLIAWQGRYIPCGKNKIEINGKAPAKWFSQGKIHEIIHPLQVNQQKAVLVEDIISAIKVSKIQGAIPIFGSSVSTQQILRLKHVVEQVWIWLDPDMRVTSIKLAHTCRTLGLEANVIFSDRDPKEESMDTIKSLLTTVIT